MIMMLFFSSSASVASTISSVENTANVTLPVGSNTSNLTKWSDFSSWQNSIKPGKFDDVIIPVNSVVLLDENVKIKSLTVKGKLIIDPSRNISISTEYILVQGAGSYFEWGSPDEPYSKNGQLTLVGSDTEALIPGTGVSTKAFIVMSGRLELHGSDTKKNWTVLNETVARGATEITVAEPTGWKSGDKIVIATTDRYMLETEERIVAAVRPSGETFILDKPLNFHHFGELQAFSNKRESWELDERAEVGLLSKSIRIQGDEKSKELLFGGHMMFMNNPEIHISGIELFHMGQTAKLARYPIHWHLVGDGEGDYVKNTSIHHTFNRAITVHGTDNLVVENNVIHSSYGHAIFLEDAVEVGNVFHKNLVINTRRPSSEHALVPSDDGKDGIRIEGPAAFWIANPNNDFTENVAAGSDGAGFWFGLPAGPTGPGGDLPEKANLNPRKQPLGVFDKNKAHSCHSGLHFDHSHNMAMTEIENSHYQPTNAQGEFYMPEVTNYTGYKCFRAWWTRTIGPGINFKRTIVADCIGESNTVSSFEGRTENSLFVGYSENNPKGTFFDSYAVSLYDGQIQVINCHFENYDRPLMSSFVWFDGAVNRTNDFQLGSTFKNAYYFNFDTRMVATQVGSIIHDADAAMTSYTGGSIVMEHPFLIDDENFSLVQTPTRGFKSPYHFGALWLTDKEGNEHGWNTSWSKGHVLHSDENHQLKHQIPVTTVANRVYTLRPVERYSNSISLNYRYGQNGDKLDAQFIDSPVALSVSGATQMSSKEQVFSSQASSWAWVEGVLYLRLVAAGDPNPNDLDWRASGIVTITHSGGASLAVLPGKPEAFDLISHVQNRRISAVKYDYGGDGSAYHETGIYPNRPNRFNDASYLGDLLRLGEVAQMEPNLPDPDGNLVHAIHKIKSGEWWNYTVDITETGTYPFHLLAASAVSNNRVRVKVDGIQVINTIFGATGSASSFQEKVLGNLMLTKGIHTVKIEAGSDDFKFGWFSVGIPANINKSPNLSIVNADELEQKEDGEAVVVNIKASDEDGAIASVSLYLNGQLIEKKTSEPYVFDTHPLDELEEGVYALKVEAVDDKEASAIENISLTIGDDANGGFWDFTSGFEGWSPDQINASAFDGILTASFTGEDPKLTSPSNLSINASSNPFIFIRAKNLTSQNQGEVFFSTSENSGFSGDRRLSFSIVPNDNQFRHYIIDMSAHSDWNGNLKQVRIDPIQSGNSGTMEIDFIAIASKDQSDCNGNWLGYAYEDSCGNCVGGETGQLDCEITTEWTFNEDGNTEGWTSGSSIIGSVSSGNYLLDISDTNAEVTSSEEIALLLFHYPYLKLTVESNKSGQLILSWGTEDYKGFDQSRSALIEVDATSVFEDYVFDLSENENWQGYIDQLKLTFKTGEGSLVKIDHISFESNALYDCHGDWNGEAVLDNCDVCSGGNTSVEPCVISEILENVLNAKPNFYPNPTSGTVYLEKKHEYKVYNMMGRLIDEGFDNQLNLSREPLGVYILRIKDQSIKIVISH